MENTEVDSIWCSDVDSATLTPSKKRSLTALSRGRVLQPLSPTSDAGSDSVLSIKEKHAHSSRNKERDSEQTPSTCGKKSRLAPLQRSPRRRPDEEIRELLQESDDETDTDNPSLSSTMSSASALRRSPRKKARKSTKEASHKTLDTTNKSPRNLEIPSQETITSSRAFSKGIQGQLKEMQATQKELLSTMKVVRNEVRDLKREIQKREEETPENISVPNRIRKLRRRRIALDKKKNWTEEKKALVKKVFRPQTILQVYV